MPRSGRRSLPAAILLLAAALLALAGPASGHAQVIEVDPPDGTILAIAPSAVTISFNEGVALAPGGITVVDATGLAVDTEPEVVDAARIVQPLPPLRDGWYVVTWAVVSEDGHPIRRASVFGVGDADAALRPAPPASPAAILPAAARALADLGTLVLAGALAATILLRAPVAPVAPLVAAGGLLALAGTALLVLTGLLAAGQVWLATIAGLVAVARIPILAVALLLRDRPRAASLPVLAALLLIAPGGHAAGDPIAVALLAAHLLLAATWLGAAPALLAVQRHTGTDDPTALAVARAFSRLAGIALVIVGLAGAALTWRLTEGFVAGVTPWLAVLLAKIGLVAIAALAGALGRRHLAREPRRSGLRRLFLLDALLLAGVATLSGALALDAPRAGLHDVHGGPDGAARCTLRAGETALSAILRPALPGANEILLGGVPADAAGLTLELRHPAIGEAPVAATPVAGTEGWTAPVALPFAGDWTLTVALRPDRFTLLRGDCTLRVGG